MGFVSGIVVYICLWWTVIFCVLPFGVERDETTQGAPKNPHIKEKFIATSIISAVLWIAVYALIALEIIDFREIAAKMSQSDYN